MDDIFRFLGGADTAMVAVTFALCQIVKRILPKPPEAVAKVNRWSVSRDLKWVPFASAFVIGMTLSVAFCPDRSLGILDKMRVGLQTGAYSVVAWELWSNVRKLFGE